MQKILLAVEAKTFNSEALRYAAQLCRRMKAELNILQILDLPSINNSIKAAKKKTRRIGMRSRAWLEGMMAAAAFAQAGDDRTALDLIEGTRKEIERIMKEPANRDTPFQIALKTGKTEDEIIGYVRRNRNVVLALYDPSSEKQPGQSERKTLRPGDIARRLPVPFVMIDFDPSSASDFH